MTTADRYLLMPGRRGVPRIYHGDLRGISQAIADAVKDSEAEPGTHIIYAIYEGTRFRFRVYERGECTHQVTEQPITLSCYSKTGGNHHGF